jgi:hypothetical protein
MALLGLSGTGIADYPQNDGRIQLTLGQQNGTAQVPLLQGLGFRPETYRLRDNEGHRSLTFR